MMMRARIVCCADDDAHRIAQSSGIEDAVWPRMRPRRPGSNPRHLHSTLKFAQQGELRTISFWARLRYSVDIRIVLKSGDPDGCAFRNSTLDRDDCERAGIVIAGIGAIRPAARQPSDESSCDESSCDESSSDESSSDESCDESCDRFAASAGRALESRGVMP
jgi:hypothetical protein